MVYAGTLNMTGALRVRVEHGRPRARCSTRSTRCSRSAIEQRSSYVRLADRASRLYAPVVHLTALATFLGWVPLWAGWQPALIIAITVLIITCPCALGLAVPAVQVVAAGAMFRRDVMLNSGDALERLADIDTIVFDKTGTLTLPHPQARQRRGHRARGSRAGRRARAGQPSSARQRGRRRRAGAPRRSTAQEFPGEGRRERIRRRRAMRLGSLAFCNAEAEAAPVAAALARRFADRISGAARERSSSRCVRRRAPTRAMSSLG